MARLAAAGKRPSAIAAELGLAKSTVTHRLRHLGAASAGPYLGRRAIVEMLARSAVRVSELCDIKLRHVRLHDSDPRPAPYPPTPRRRPASARCS